MTDSVDRKDNSKEAITERLSKYTVVPKSERTEAHQIPQWVKVATARMEVLGESYNEAAEPFGRTGKTLSGWAKSPWVKGWRASFHEIMESPEEVARLILRGSVAEAAMDMIFAIEGSKRKQDWKEVRLATRDILQSHGVLHTAKGGAGGDGGVTINITLPKGVSTEPLTVEADYEVIENESDPD